LESNLMFRSKVFLAVAQGVTKAEAFRATQMEVGKKHRLPFYWAGFILMD
jgi:CHAT domain-containing protein